MNYTIDFKKTYEPTAESIEFGTITAVVCCLGLLNKPVQFTFYENSNNNGKLHGRHGDVEIVVKIGDATIEELIDAYFNRKIISGTMWKVMVY